MDVEQFRSKLLQCQTRATAIDSALRGGESYVEPAIQLLNDRNESVRWSAVRILSEIGDERAIGPLIALLDRGKDATDVANALRSITGHDLGEDAGAWRDWALKNPAARASAALGILSDEDLLAAATRDLPVTIRRAEQQYVADISLPEGRSQRVLIDFSRTDPNGKPVVQLCTPCGDADERRYEWALKLNMSIPYSGIAIARLGEKLSFVIVSTYLRATVHPEDIATTLMTLAREGDSIEKQLAQEDRF